MITEKIGNVLDNTNGIIIHGCNAKGLMGAGAALAVKEKYPKCFSAYKMYCSACDIDNFNPLGTVNFYHHDNQLVIANAITQLNPGKNANIQAIQSCLETIFKYAEYYDYDVHSVKVGCGIGGLDWNDVKEVYEYTLTLYPKVNLTIWSLE